MKPLTSAVISIVAIVIIAAAAARVAGVGENDDTVTVVHWSTGHLIRDGSGLRLLRQMADDFNDEKHRTASGKQIKVEIYYASGAVQTPELVSRLTKGTPQNSKLPDPTLVTPSASHWLATVNYQAGRNVFDLRDTERNSLARSYVGIVTYRDMAECLGWPRKDIGYADILALREDPRGWSAYPCAKAEWGERPLLAFTDPSTSDTGRAVLYLLYAIAAGKLPETLTQADIERPDVIDSVKEFQSLIDHYMIDSTTVNSKVYQGPQFGHFFLMPEDNLIHLYDGTEKCFENGIEGHCPKLTRDVVMIYPKEGSLLRENCACMVDASWVSAEQREGADQWIRYLREDAQQRSFMASGFRPGTGLAVTEPISGRYGLNAATPKTVLHAERIEPALGAAIDEAWPEVKKPGIVTFVIDTSGSMDGEKLKQAKSGVVKALDQMAQNNEVGFLSFSSKVGQRVSVAPLSTGKFRISGVVDKLNASGDTALYDAIIQGISMSDDAAGPDDAIRAVVVLTDGKANAGTRLDLLVTMASRDEVAIRECSGFGSDSCIDITGHAVALSQVLGTGLKVHTTHAVQVFFIGVGEADLNVGRILAQATGAEFQGASEKDLAEVIEAFSRWF